MSRWSVSESKSAPSVKPAKSLALASACGEKKLVPSAAHSAQILRTPRDAVWGGCATAMLEVGAVGAVCFRNMEISVGYKNQGRALDDSQLRKLLQLRSHGWSQWMRFKT